MTAGTENRRDGEPTPVDFNGLFIRISAELQAASRDLARLQMSTSRLLEKSNHPDVAEEMHVLQDLDRLHQTMDDLAKVATVVTSQSVRNEESFELARKEITLESLRRRLFPDLDQDASPIHTGDISWL